MYAFKPVRSGAGRRGTGRRSEGRRRAGDGGTRPGRWLRRGVALALAVALAALASACGDGGSSATAQRSRPRSSPTAGPAQPPPVEVPPRSAGQDTGARGPQSVAEAEIPTNVSYADAEAAYRKRDYGQAERLFTGYTRERPDNPWGHYMLGLSAWKAGDPDLAIESFQQALDRDPKQVKSLVNLSRVLLEQGRPEDALQRMQSALALDSTSAEVWRVLGNARVDAGDRAEAEEAYLQAVRLDPRDAWSLNDLGLLRLRRGDYEEALAPLARAAELRGDVSVFQNNLGAALERTGHPVEAARAYRAALAADSGYAKASLSLARVEAVGGTPDSTLDLSALAASFDPDEASTVGTVAAEPSPPQP